MELRTIQTTTTWNEAASRINSNNQKIDVEVEKLKNSTYKHKGYFKTLEGLETTYPSSNVGSVAWVGAQYPFTLYRWDNRDGWTTDGTTGGDESVELGEYYTKEETQSAIEDFHIILSQEEYDNLATKEEKLYFCYEE